MKTSLTPEDFGGLTEIRSDRENEWIEDSKGNVFRVLGPIRWNEEIKRWEVLADIYNALAFIEVTLHLREA